MIHLSIPFWSDFILRLFVGNIIADFRFQSHFGLILSLAAVKNKELKQLLSIPFWSDFICFQYPAIQALVDLSIPFWSDFIDDHLHMNSLTGYDFQSHFGLILSVLAFASGFVSFWPFNPILVWFYQNSVWRCCVLYTILSIPFWSDFIRWFFLEVVLMEKFDFQSHFGLILSGSDYCS